MANGLLAPMAVETVLVAYRNFDSKFQLRHLPFPGCFLTVAVLYGALALIPENGEKVATLLGWGYVIATALKLLDPAAPHKKSTTTATTPTVKSKTKPGARGITET